MLRLIQVLLINISSCLVFLTIAYPDSAGNPPLPGPGLSYGGIPYGSMSGNVAAYFRQRQAPPRGHVKNFATSGAGAVDVDFSPIEQWLR